MNQIALTKKSRFPRLARITAVAAASVVAFSANAAITGAQITSAYGDSGGSDIADTAGLIVITVCAALMAVSIGIRLFRKG